MIDILLKRRSTRNFTDRKVEPEKTEKLVQAALLSPTARNLHSCEFITVENKDIIKKLSESKPHGSSFMAEAPLAVVIIGDTDKTDVWIEDASIAAIVIQLEAEKLDLGSCWVQIRNRKYSENKTSNDYIGELLNIPENYKVEAVIAIGYRDSITEGHSLESLDFKRHHKENFRFEKQ